MTALEGNRMCNTEHNNKPKTKYIILTYFLQQNFKTNFNL